jgi:hypothetical protein
LLIVGGMISSGVVRTESVWGWYWMSSNTGVRSTTAPGVRARSVPTSKASAGTIEGTRGGPAMSRMRLPVPRRALPPPESIAAFQATGLSSGLLLGERASTRLLAMNVTRSESRHSIGTSCTRPSTAVPVAR